MKHIYLLTLVASLLVGCSDGGSTAPSNAPSTDSEHVITLNGSDCTDGSVGIECLGALDVFPSYIDCVYSYVRVISTSGGEVTTEPVVETANVRVNENGDVTVYPYHANATITCVYRD